MKDIDLERNGFLHVDDIASGAASGAQARAQGNGRRINELIKPGHVRPGGRGPAEDEGRAAFE